MTGLGQRLKTLRKATGMTQQQVADKLGLHRTAYTKYETDQAEPPLDAVCGLAALFSVTLDDLLR